MLHRRLRKKSAKSKAYNDDTVIANETDHSEKTSVHQKVSFVCGGSDVRSQSSRLSAANSVMLACRQLLGPLHELPPAQYISRRMEDHMQCSAEMVKLKACSEIARHSQRQEMDEWKQRFDAHQLSVMLQKSSACGELPEQLWRSEVLGNLKESHPGPSCLQRPTLFVFKVVMAPRKNNKRSTDAKEPAKRQKTDEAEEEDVEAEAEVEQQGEEAHDADDQDLRNSQDEEKVEQEPQEEEVHSAKEAEASAPEKVPEEKKGPTSRLMIRQIVLENFKSYGGVKVIGPFHKSFSSIVGPNGSGKSNTIDALLFVFGKRAKKMRLNKVSELIHCSNAMPNLNSAKVEVTFQDILDTGDGPEDYEVVEGSVLTVTREAFRNNQSKYYVDGKTSNFTDVVQLLRKRGVDLDHNRFLILQGEVEQISLMKPKAQSVHEDGLLEYLEDSSNVVIVTV
eukprot:symbB.v1.2.023382.t1/scaffold2106.1/size89218/1